MIALEGGGIHSDFVFLVYLPPIHSSPIDTRSLQGLGQEKVELRPLIRQFMYYFRMYLNRKSHFYQ